MTIANFNAEKYYGCKYASFAHYFRTLAFKVDQNPDTILDYIDSPAVQFVLNDRDSDTLKRTEYLEALAYGDPGVLLACPGPSLSGLLMRELGLPEQIVSFYDLLLKHQCRTFFALSEPQKGSDANNIQARLVRYTDSRNYFRLTGTKSFFGNASVAQMGVVLARISDSPVGIRAVWLTPDLMRSETIEKMAFQMHSLRGAQIGAIRFSETKIPAEQVLGHHLSACQNGLLGILKVFNRLRTGVGALAIGQAQAVCDLTLSIKKSEFRSLHSTFVNLNCMLSTARNMLRSAAKTVDLDPYNSNVVSGAKMYATQTAEAVITECFSLCQFNELVENPWLVKSHRDVFCWEYMEGTTNIQRKQIASGLNQYMNNHFRFGGSL
jgi:acyl-CoA dehydrogenase